MQDSLVANTAVIAATARAAGSSRRLAVGLCRSNRRFVVVAEAHNRPDMGSAEPAVVVDIGMPAAEDIVVPDIGWIGDMKVVADIVVGIDEAHTVVGRSCSRSIRDAVGGSPVDSSSAKYSTRTAGRQRRVCRGLRLCIFE